VLSQSSKLTPVKSVIVESQYTFNPSYHASLNHSMGSRIQNMSSSHQQENETNTLSRSTEPASGEDVQPAREYLKGLKLHLITATCDCQFSNVDEE